MKWYRKAADQGDAAAQYNLGVMYANGRGVTQDDARRCVVPQGRRPGERPRAVQPRRMYANGHGVPQDYAEAVSGTARPPTRVSRGAMQPRRMYATARGCHRTMLKRRSGIARPPTRGRGGGRTTLAGCTKTGGGSGENDVEAVKWFRKSAEQGHALAQFNLGMAYEDGRGVPQDFVKAHTWFNLAASRATDTALRDQAAKNRDMLAAKMMPDQIAEAQRFASEWRPKN